MKKEVLLAPVAARQETVAPRAGGIWLAAVLLLAASGLMFELMLTRVFSATIWYHYTFVAISVALLGWGLGGFLVYLFGLARKPQQARGILTGLSLVLAVMLPAFLYIILQLPFTPERLTTYFLLSIVPFLAGGAGLSLAFEVNGRDINRLYFADLVGAAGGVLAVPLVIGQLGAETAILATAILPALAAVLLSLPDRTGPRRGWQVLAGLVLVAVVAITGWNHREQARAAAGLAAQPLTIRDAPGKALYRLLKENPQTAKVVSDRWNAYSRITAVTGFDDFHVARLFIDSDAETSVLPWDGKTNAGLTGRTWFRAFPLRLTANPKVLVIGPGGGTDVVMAVLAGSPQVTGVEMNPLIVDAVRMFGAQAGNLYTHEKMNLVMDEGRNFIRRTPEKYDAIVLGFVDSWASVASGGLALTENYLYTQDAIEAYYDHLTPDGALVIVRWPEDVRRLVANSVNLLATREGMPIERIGRHILAVSERKWAMEDYRPEPVETVFMLTKSPLTAEATDRLLAGYPDAHVAWSAFRPSEEVYADLFNGRITFEQYTDSFDTMATPVHDDHPFYFATWKPVGIPPFAARLVALPVGAVVGFTALLLVAARVLKFRVPGGSTVAYFGALGVGFIVVEIALIQRLILLLGHPIYTLVVILFTLLLAGGLGSRFAARFAPERIRATLGWVIPAVVVLVVIGAFGLPYLVKATIHLDQAQRILVAAALTFPFGFLMGMPFPLGLRRHAQDANGTPVSALWGINGVASVVGSVSAMMLAVAAGFTWVFLAGAACYALAWAVRPR